MEPGSCDLLHKPQPLEGKDECMLPPSGHVWEHDVAKEETKTSQRLMKEMQERRKTVIILF